MKNIQFVPYEEAVDSIPDGIARVQVRDQEGNMRYKQVGDLLSTDEVCFRQGRPITMKRHPGRPWPAGKTTQPLGAMLASPKIREENDIEEAVPSGEPKRHAIGPVTRKGLDLRRKAIKDNPVVQYILEDPYSDKVLDQIMRELVEEAAGLKYERKLANSREAIQISLRRVATLETIISTWFKRREQMAAKSVDLKSSAFRRLFMYIVQTFCECMEEAGADETLQENVKMELARRFQNDATWEDGAKEAMRGT